MVKYCKSCAKSLRSSNTSGYCWGCFKVNTDGARTNYNKEYRKRAGLVPLGRVYSCRGCSGVMKKGSATGYCGKCFHSGVGGVKEEYTKNRKESGKSRLSNWKAKGARLTEENIARHYSVSNCDICNKHLSQDKVLDHCHKTGDYRGTLCRQCNGALGKLGDCIDLVVARLRAYQELPSSKAPQITCEQKEKIC